MAAEQLRVKERAWRDVPPPPPPGASPVEFGENWLLRDVPRDVLAAFAGQCEERRFTSGEIIFREGDRTDGLYLVASGFVRIVTHRGQGEMQLARLGPGETIGEMGVIDDAPRSATAIAGSFTVLYFVPREPFLDLVERQASLALKLLAMMSQRLRRTNVRVVTLPSGEVV